MTRDQIKHIAKAIAAGLGAGASYFAGVMIAIDPAAGFGDLTTAQWLLSIPAVLVVFGITWRIPNAGNPPLNRP